MRVQFLLGSMAQLGLVTFVVTLGTIDASARSATCDRLDRQLASLSNNGKPILRAGKNDRAVRQVETQLRQARVQAKKAGCGRGLFSRGDQQCSKIDRSIDKLSARLDSLKRAAVRQVASNDTQASRRKILAALKANRCNERGTGILPTTANADRPSGNLFERLFGGPVERTKPIDDARKDKARETRSKPKQKPANRERDAKAESVANGGVRTLCVRTCDGYYFPISFSTSTKSLGRDQKNCEAACPGTDVKLYTYKVPDEESDEMLSMEMAEAMVSVEGERYTALSTAFNYRMPTFRAAPACTCQRPGLADAEKKDGAAVPEAKQEELAIVPIPTPRPDPEVAGTIVGSDLHLTAGGVSDVVNVDETLTTAATGRRSVRIVGPAFLPDKEGAMNLRGRADRDGEDERRNSGDWVLDIASEVLRIIM